MDTDKIKIYGARVRVDSMTKVCCCLSAECARGALSGLLTIVHTVPCMLCLCRQGRAHSRHAAHRGMRATRETSASQQHGAAQEQHRR